jgi:HK97 family phage major capsid protein
MEKTARKKKTVEQEIKTAESQPQQRSEAIPTGRSPVDRSERIIELSFLSEAPVERSYGVEILDHSAGSIDLEWLNSGNAPFMVAPLPSGDRSHGGAVQAGSVVKGSAKVGPDRKTRAAVKISRSSEGDAFLNDYDDDIAINISADYRQGKPQITRGSDGVPVVRWMHVEPRGITRVPFPADETVGIGRSADGKDAQEDEPTNKPSEVTTLTAEEQRAADEAQAVATRAAEIQRLDDVQALGKRFGMEERANLCALEGMTVEQTRAVLLAEKKKQQDETVEGTREDRTQGAKKHPFVTIHQTVTSFTGARDDAAKKAYRFANWFIASNLNDVRALRENEHTARAIDRAIRYCKDYDILIQRGQVEGENTAGGFLVPHEFNNEMIDLREKWGVGRRNIKIVPMSSDSRSQPRRKSGLTAYVIGEGTGATESQKGWDRVSLSTKKIGALTRFSSEIAEDGLVSMGDDLASEIAYAFAEFEDTVIFTGDGSKNHARIVGAVTALQNLEDGDGAAGVIEATGNTWDEFVLQDFLNVIGAQPEYAETPNVKWFCSKLFWATVMVRLQKAASGNDESNIISGGKKQFLGYPVEVSQKFPKSPTNGKIMCLFGDLKMAGMMGDRRQTTIRLSDQQHWEEEEIAVAGSERFDVSIHDIGDDVNAGPLLALKCKAS